ARTTLRTQLRQQPGRRLRPVAGCRNPDTGFRTAVHGLQTPGPVAERPGKARPVADQPGPALADCAGWQGTPEGQGWQGTDPALESLFAAPGSGRQGSVH